MIEIMRRAAICLFIALTLSAAGKKPAKAPAPVPAAAPQRNDEGYTAKIREYTTEPFFLTELVDHLPASDSVPTPEKVLGYAIGTPNKLTYTKDIYRYMRELEKASKRVKVFTIGHSEEGREIILVAVSDEGNIAKLDHYKQLTARLADPRRTPRPEADRLIAEALPFYWASGSIHSPETGSPEMLMELAYRLAVEESPLVQNIRKNSIVLITPVSEADGRDRAVDVYNYRKANPGKTAPTQIYWGKYVAHDNNRDGLGMALALSRTMMSAFLEYHPTVLHDLHESQPFLYVSTGMGPYNAWLDPLVIDEWQKMAYVEIEEMTKRGVPGVWTHGYYDGWAPNYMFYVANGHNSIGRFYETFGGFGADTGERTVPESATSRTWYRPNPPLPRVNWSLRDNINLQQSALLFSMNNVAANRREFLGNFYLKSQRSVDKARNEGPAAWVIPGDDPRPGECAKVVNLLRLQGVEVDRLASDTEVAVGQDGTKRKFAAGSYVVRMDQPYSRMADMLLDTQYYNVNDPPPYDDTGWTLGPLHNITTVRVAKPDILQASMTLLVDAAKPAGRIAGPVFGRGLPHQSQRRQHAGDLPFQTEGRQNVRRRRCLQGRGPRFRRRLVHRQDGGQSGRPAHAAGERRGGSRDCRLCFGRSSQGGHARAGGSAHRAGAYLDQHAERGLVPRGLRPPANPLRLHFRPEAEGHGQPARQVGRDSVRPGGRDRAAHRQRPAHARRSGAVEEDRPDAEPGRLSGHDRRHARRHGPRRAGERGPVHRCGRPFHHHHRERVDPHRLRHHRGRHHPRHAAVARQRQRNQRGGGG